MLKPFVLAKNDREMTYIETSVNSIWISVKIKKTIGTGVLLTHLMERFIALRADKFNIIRKKPAHEGYDFSFLITENHLEELKKEEIINFIISFIVGIEKDISDIKSLIGTRSKLAASYFLMGVSG